MKKNVIQEAIRDQLQSKVITERPIGQHRMFDPISRGVSSVGNMFANIGGQMKLGAVNKQLQRSADRIEDEWDSASDVIADKAEKLIKSKNPRVKASGNAVLNNKDQIDAQMDGAVKQIRNISSAGADVPGQPGQGNMSALEKSIAPRQATDEYGNKYTEYGVDRWLKRMGVDAHSIGKASKNQLSKLFMDLIALNVNPLEIPVDKQLPLVQYALSVYARMRSGEYQPHEAEQHLKDIVQRYLGGGPLPKQMANPGGVAGKLPTDGVGAGQQSPAGKQMSDKRRVRVARKILDNMEDLAAKSNFNMTDRERETLMQHVVAALNSNRNISSPKELMSAAMKELRKIAAQRGAKPAQPQMTAPTTQQLDQAASKMPAAWEQPSVAPTMPQQLPQQPAPAGPVPSAQLQPEPAPIPLTKVKQHKPTPALDMPPELDAPAQKLSSFMEPQLAKQSSGGIDPAQMLPKSIKKGPLPVKDNGSEIQVGSEAEPGFGPKKKEPTDPEKKKEKSSKKSK